MTEQMPDTVEYCTNVIIIAINELGTKHPDIEKVRIGEIASLAEHAEKLHEEEIGGLREEIDEHEEEIGELREELSVIKKGLNAICTEINENNRRKHNGKEN